MIGSNCAAGCVRRTHRRRAVLDGGGVLILVAQGRLALLPLRRHRRIHHHPGTPLQTLQIFVAAGEMSMRGFGSALASSKPTYG
jgi:hypothetical protein